MLQPVLSRGKASPKRSAGARGYLNAQQESLQKSMDRIAHTGAGAKTTDGMYKFMIFAIDLGEASKKESKLPKTLDDFKHKICDAQRVEAIFAGYQGVGRVPLDTDEEFREFMSTVDSQQEAVVIDEEESPLVMELRAEIASLRRDRDRMEKKWEAEKAQLHEQIQIYEARCVSLKQELEDLRQQFQRKLLKEQAARQQVEQQLERSKAEVEKLKDQLQKVSAVYEEKMREQQAKFDEEKRRLMSIVKSQKEEIASLKEKVEELEEQVA